MCARVSVCCVSVCVCVRARAHAHVSVCMRVCVTVIAFELFVQSEPSNRKLRVMFAVNPDLVEIQTRLGDSDSDSNPYRSRLEYNMHHILTSTRIRVISCEYFFIHFIVYLYYSM